MSCYKVGYRVRVINGLGKLQYAMREGLAMAFSEKMLGNKGNYYNIFKKWLPEEN